MKQNLHCGDTLEIDVDKLKLLIQTVADNYINQCKTNAKEDYFLR